MDQGEESIILSDDDQDDSMPDRFGESQTAENYMNHSQAPDPYNGVNADQRDFIQAHPYDINKSEATSTSENSSYGAATNVQDYHYIQPAGSHIYPEDANLDEEEDEEETGQKGQACSICGEKRLMNVAHQCRHDTKKRGRKRLLAQTSEGEYMCSVCPYISESYRSVYQHCKNLGHKIMKSSNETVVTEKVQIVEQRNRPIPVASLSSMRHPAEQPVIRITNGAIRLEKHNSYEEIDVPNQEGVLSAFATVAELVTGDENPNHVIGLDDLEDDMDEEIPSQIRRPRKKGKNKCPVDPNSPAPKKLPDGQFQCNFCMFKSRLRTSLVKHQWTHTDFYPYQCVACHKQLRYINQHKCKVTGKMGNISSVIPNISQPGPSATNSAATRVPEAHERIKSVKTGAKTVRTARGSTPIDPDCPRPTRGEDGMFQCNFCEFQSKYSQSTAVHQWRHTGFKPFKCLVCKKSFIQKALLTKHVCRLSNPIFRPKIKTEPKTEPSEEPSRPPVSSAAGRPPNNVDATEENTYIQATTYDNSVTPPIVIAPPVMMNAELPVGANLSRMEVPTTTHPNSSTQFYADSAVSAVGTMSQLPVIQSVVSQLNPVGTGHSVQMLGMSQSAGDAQLLPISCFIPTAMTPQDVPYNVNATAMPASTEGNIIHFPTEKPNGGLLEYEAATRTDRASVQSDITPASVHMPQESTVNGAQCSQMLARPHPSSAFVQSGMSLTDAVVIADDDTVDTRAPYTSNMSMPGASVDPQVPLPLISNPMIISADLDPANTPAVTRPSNTPQVPQVQPTPQLSPARSTMTTQPTPTPTSNLYKCQLCKIYFEDDKMYKTHMDHHGQKVGRCAKCSGYFSTPLAFFNHMECQHNPRAAGLSPVAVNNPVPTNTPRGSFRAQRTRSRGGRGRGIMGRTRAQYSANPPQPNPNERVPLQNTSPLHNANPSFRQPPPIGVFPRNPPAPNRMGHQNTQPMAHSTSGGPNRQVSPMSRPNEPTQQVTPVRPGNSVNRPNNIAHRASGPQINQMSPARPGNHPRRLTGITPIHRSPITDNIETTNKAQDQQQAPQPYHQTAQNAADYQSIHQRPRASQSLPQNRMAQTSQQMPPQQMPPTSRNVVQASPQMTRVAPNQMPHASQNVAQMPVTQTSPQMPPHQVPPTSRNVAQASPQTTRVAPNQMPPTSWNVAQASPQMTRVAPNQMPRASHNVTQMPVTQTSPQQMPPQQMPQNVAQASPQMTRVAPNQKPRASQNVAQMPVTQTTPPMPPHQMPPHQIPPTSQNVAQMPVTQTSPQMPPHQMPPHQMPRASRNVAQDSLQMTHVAPNQMPHASQNVAQMPVTQTTPPMPPHQMPPTSQNVAQTSPQMTPLAPNRMPPQNAVRMPVPQANPQMPSHQMPHTSQNVPQTSPQMPHQMPRVSNQPVSHQSVAPSKPPRQQVARRGRPLSVSIPQHQHSTSQHLRQQVSPQTQQAGINIGYSPPGQQRVSQNPMSQQNQNNAPNEPDLSNVIVID